MIETTTVLLAIQIIFIGGRILQLGFASVLIAVSVPLYNLLALLDDYCRFFDACGLLATWLAAVRYSQFVGAFGLLQALVGLVFIVASSRGWVGKNAWVAVLIVDAVAMVCCVVDLILLSVLSGQSTDMFTCEGDEYTTCVQVGVEIGFAVAGFISSSLAITLACWRQSLYRKGREA